MVSRMRAMGHPTASPIASCAKGHDRYSWAAESRGELDVTAERKGCDMLFEVEGVVGFALILLWLYCIFDVISTDDVLVRNLPKMVWLFIVIILPDIGSIAWLL